MLNDRGERNCRVSPCRLTGSWAPEEEPFSVHRYGHTLVCPSELSGPSRHGGIIIDQRVDAFN